MGSAGCAVGWRRTAESSTANAIRPLGLIALVLQLGSLSGCATGAVWNAYYGQLRLGTATEKGPLEGFYVDAATIAKRCLVVYSSGGALHGIEFDCEVSDVHAIEKHLPGLPADRVLSLRFELSTDSEGARAFRKPWTPADGTLTLVGFRELVRSGLRVRVRGC